MGYFIHKNARLIEAGILTRSPLITRVFNQG